MADGVLAWALRQRKEWQQSIDAMNGGSLKMRKDGKDVTQEWIQDLTVKIHELDALVTKHEANGA